MSAGGAAKRVLVPIGDGSEEIETSCITDTLTRAGAEVTVASVMPKAREGDLCCVMSRNLKVLADTDIDSCRDQAWDLIMLPGGMPGAEHLRDSETLKAMLEAQNELKKPFGAVCAAPAVVLASHGLLAGDATCYPAPAFREALPSLGEGPVVRDGHVLTSQGPGTSLEFALAAVEVLYGAGKAKELAEQMLVASGPRRVPRRGGQRRGRAGQSRGRAAEWTRMPPLHFQKSSTGLSSHHQSSVYSGKSLRSRWWGP